MAGKRSLISTRKPHQARSQETVESILEATAQILGGAHGANVTTNHIAERAGVSIGTLYQYFKDKRAVLSELFIRELQKDSEAIEEVLDVHEYKSIDEVVPRLIGVVLTRLSEQPKVRQALMEEFRRSKDFRKRKDIKKHLSIVISNYLRSHPQFHMPKDIRLELLIMVNAVEAGLNAAIWELGVRLQRPRLVNEVSDLVLRYLSKYRITQN